MKKRLIINIIFWLLLIIFILLCFAQTTNKKPMSLEIIFKNNECRYIKSAEIYDKIKMGLKQKQSGYDLKDINTRLLEDSIETLSYVKNAEVYLSLDKLKILIQQETPFIRTLVNGDTCFFTEDSVKLNLVDGKLPKVLFFIDDISLQSWEETVYLANYVYYNGFLNSIISKISHNQGSEYILYSDLFDFTINIGSVNKLEEKLERIKLFFTTISKDKRLSNDSILMKELNVAYDNQIICVN